MEKDVRNADSSVSAIGKKKVRSDYLFFGLFDVRDKSLIPLQIVALGLALYEAVSGIMLIVDPDSLEFAHTFAHLGSYSLAYSAALFVVAFKPARARGLLVLFIAATLGFLATSIFDIARGNAGLATEVSHITKLIPPFIVWLISKRVVFPVKPPEIYEKQK